MKKLQYDLIQHVDSWENPIAKEGFYQECQIAEFTGCWDENEQFYEVLFYKDETFCIDGNGKEAELPDTEKWVEDDIIFIYEDEGKYYQQTTNGNHWCEVTEPKLIDAQ